MTTSAIPACTCCAAEQVRRFMIDPPADRPGVGDPESASAVLTPLLEGRDRECCILLSVDAKHRLVGVDTVSVGSVNHTFMAPREVYRDALLRGASAIVLGHNHPSGDCRPSPDDLRVTRRLAEGGELLGVGLLDHVIVGRGDFYSMAREGHL